MSTISSAPPEAGAPFGGAEAFDDPVVAHALGREELPRELDIFGGDPHAPAAPRMEQRRHVLEVGHGAHVDPGARHGHHHIGMAEAERGQEGHAVIGVRHGLAQQVLARDPEMRIAFGQLGRDLGDRQKGDLERLEAGQPAAVVARAAGLHQRHAGAGEEGRGVFLQPSLRGHGEHEGLVAVRHAFAPAPSSRSTQMAAPTAGMGFGLPSACASRS